MPTKVNLKPGTRVIVSGHPATLTELGEFEFDLPNSQVVGESLMNDPHNFRLNTHLMPKPEVVESGAVEPWIVYDEEPVPATADQGFEQVIDEPVESLEDAARLERAKRREEAQPKKKAATKSATKKPVKRAASKPVVETAKKTVKKKGKK